MKFSNLLLLALASVICSFSITSNGTRLPKELKKLKGLHYIHTGNKSGQKIASFYMFKTEVTVLEYNHFLAWLKTEGNTEQLERAKVHSENWKNSQLEMANELVDRYALMSNYPVVNITKEAAQMYCDWLTDIWNKKLDNMQVRFRLPTELEWEYAALGGRDEQYTPYPWGGPYCRNKKGQYLARYKDGVKAFGPQKVEVYTPNDFGLYDMSGNVAEMIMDKDIAKGGSWNDVPEAIQITAAKDLDISPEIGFRPVMVIENK